MSYGLHLEPFSGISGDMFLGALAPLLNAEEELIALPELLGLPEVEVRFENVVRSTLQCRHAVVTFKGDAPEEQPSAHGHHHHHHHHGHDHDHAHDHTHRAYRDIVELLNASPLPKEVLERALDLFLHLAEAEAAMHGTSVEEVHFHEVGGEDAIVDLVGAAWLLDKLNPETVTSTPVCVGSGFANTAHGRLPVPAPATQRLLEGMPTFAGPIEMEMTTPTGAAILRHLNPDFSSDARITTATGLGAGSKDPHSQPNALRVSLVSSGQTEGEAITLLQTNLDQLSGEELGADLIGDLLDQGARDAWLTPITMKKGRPAQMLEVLCFPADASRLSTWILQNLTTLGVRRFDGSRTILKRSIETVSTPYGDIEVKVHHMPDGSIRRIPEYESCHKASQEHGVSLTSVRDSVS